MAGNKLRSLLLIASVTCAVLLGAVAATAGSAASAKWIVFAGVPSGQHVDQLYRIRSSGEGLQVLTKGQYPSIAPAFSPDGKRIAFSRAGVGILTMDVDGKDVHRLTTNGRDSFPAWSPDGKQIAFLRSAASVADLRHVLVRRQAAAVAEGARSGSADVELRRADGPVRW